MATSRTAQTAEKSDDDIPSKLVVRLSQRTRVKAKVMAQARKITVSELVEQLLDRADERPPITNER